MTKSAPTCMLHLRIYLFDYFSIYYHIQFTPIRHLHGVMRVSQGQIGLYLKETPKTISLVRAPRAAAVTSPRCSRISYSSCSISSSDTHSSLSVCKVMYICVYAYAYVNNEVSISACLYVSVCMCVCVCTYTYMRIYMYVPTRVFGGRRTYKISSEEWQRQQTPCKRLEKGPYTDHATF